MEQPRTFNLLEGDLDESYFSKVLPRFNQIPNFKETLLPLTRLYDENFWTTLRITRKFFISRTDSLSWFYGDDVFEEYVKQIVSASLPAIILFDPPYKYQPVCQNLEKKLFARTKYFAGQLRRHCRSTTILSPPICLTKLEDRYLEYFVHNRNLFDVYSLHCCHNFEDGLNAQLLAFLNQVLETLRKPVWVTKWAVPACEHTIKNAKSLGSSPWVPVSHVEAVKGMEDLYRSVNQVVGRPMWFYTGLGKDDYHPDGEPTDSDMWDFMHFTGLLTFDGSIKELILDSLLEISKNELQ